MKKFFWILICLVLVASIVPMTALPAKADEGDPRYFSATGFRISDDSFWDYFQKRGGVDAFGYPVSRKFTFLGSEVQFFQRRILQLQANGVGQLNLMDPELMPYTVLNGATFPASNEALTKQAPEVGSEGYHEAALAFVDSNVPDTWEGIEVGFNTVFYNTVKYADAYPNDDGDPGWMSGINMEMWGLPTSAPAVDPNNGNFVYQRFQRGIMHFDASTGETHGILLADYLKGILLGQGLPPDLDAAAKDSRFYAQYNNGAANGLNRPDALSNSNLKDAFEKDQPQPTEDGTGAIPGAQPPTGTTGLRYGMQAHLMGVDQPRVFGSVRGAGFDWVKQQVRWEFMSGGRGQYDFSSTDSIVDNANAAGVNLLFSVVTCPSWARADGRHDGPPDNLNDFGDFMNAMASRYQGRVKAYEVWNEQNFSREWGGGSINAGAYVEMLKIAYTRIKQADPNAVVISGALTPTGVNDLNLAVDDVTYLRQMYEYQGGIIKQYSDAIGAHATGYNNAPDDWVDTNTVNTDGFKGHPSFYFRRIDQLHQVMAEFGDSHQMWITEYHWASAQPPVPAGYEWATHLSEDQVAQFFVRGFQMMKERSWVGAAFVWNLNFRMMGDPHTSETAIFGILNPDWSPRIIYSALRDMPK